MKKKITSIIIFIGILNIISLILYSKDIICLSTAVLVVAASTINIIFILYHFSTIKKLQEQTIKDPFTQIYNKQYFEDILEQKVNFAKRSNEPLALIMFDIDDFSGINNTYGHIRGDKVLLELTKTVKNSIRSYDIFSRVGGEEFTIIMSATSKKEISETAERIRDKIETANVDGIKITVSIGVSTLGENDTAETFYDNADKAMYMSKYNGKNAIYYPSDFIV